MVSEVYNIDCMDYMRNLPDKHFDLAIADPPYGDAMGGQKEIRNSRVRFGVYRTGGTWAAKYGKDIKAWDIAPSQEFFTELMRVSKIRLLGEQTIFLCLRLDASLFGKNLQYQNPLLWRWLNMPGHHSMQIQRYSSLHRKEQRMTLDSTLHRSLLPCTAGC